MRRAKPAGQLQELTCNHQHCCEHVGTPAIESLDARDAHKAGPGDCMTTGVREPIAAGLFYDQDPQQLRSDIDDMLSHATVEMGSPKALIVPHGSYLQSGDTAAAGYGLLAAERGKIQRVIVLSPSHDATFDGVALPRNVAFRTPLGDVLLEQETAATLLTLPGVTHTDRPHQREFGVEVQLPFLQRMIGRVQIVPLVVGSIGASALANLLEIIWGGPETLIVLSADLSHGLSHRDAVTRDNDTSADIADLNVDKIGPNETCAPAALRGLLTLARRRGMTTSILATSTSADADGQTDSVVGFGAFGLWESPLTMLDEADVAHLLSLAHASADTSVLGGEVGGANVERLPLSLAARRAAFVNVFVDGELRGSAGSLDAAQTLGGSVVRHAGRAVTDQRLGPISAAERARMTVGVTVLGPLERVRATDPADLAARLTPGVDGLLARHGKNRATFLPAVWGTLNDPMDFVSNLLERARIDADVPMDEIIVHRYQGLHYGAT